MATSDSPLSVPDVTLAVARGASSAPALTGGTPALSYSIAELSRDAEVTISTDGTHDFGAVGPELIMLADVSEGSWSPSFGAGVTDNSISTLTVGDVSALPGGKGIVMGSTGTDVASSGMPNARIAHGPKTRMFTSRSRYFPPANRDRMISSLVAAQVDCQVKPIWHLTDQGTTGVDTDFFLVSNEKWFFGSDKFQDVIFFSTNMTAQGIYPPAVGGGTNKLPSLGLENNNAPVDSVYVSETLWDLGSAFDNTTKDNYLWSTVYTQDGSGRVVTETSDDLLYSDDLANDLVPTNFAYPGYVRGYRSSANEEAYEAEVYVAAGQGAACRVAITDNQDIFSATKVTYLEVASWNSSLIKTKLRGGWFDINNLSGKYLCVVNAENQQIGLGVAL